MLTIETLLLLSCAVAIAALLVQVFVTGSRLDAMEDKVAALTKQSKPGPTEKRNPYLPDGGSSNVLDF